MTLAIAKLAASAGLFLMTALNLDLLRDRFLIRNFRRMKRDLDVITVCSSFFDDRFDMKLARSGKNKFLCLRIAVEMKRRVFFQYLDEGRSEILSSSARDFGSIAKAIAASGYSTLG